MSGDGRLSEEELDALLGVPPDDVTDSARRSAAGRALTPPEPSEPETIIGGPVGPSWSVRARTHVRRHPLPTALVALMLLIAVGSAAAYQRTRPPPLDTDLTATAWFVPQASDLQGVELRDGVAHARLHLQWPAGEPTLTAAGFTAPGIGPTVMKQDGADLTVSGPIDCSTVGDLSVAPALPVLHLTRTDTWGRTVRADVTVSEDGGTAGVAASEVADTLRQQCLGRIADTLQVMSITSGASSAGSSVLRLVVSNPSGHDLVLFGAQARFGPTAQIGQSGPRGISAPDSDQALPARSETVVTLPVRRDDCGAQQSTDDWLTNPEPGRRTGDFALGVAPPGRWDDTRFDTWTGLPLGPGRWRVVSAALAVPCLGAPRLSHSFRAEPPTVDGAPLGVARVRITASSGTLSLASTTVQTDVPLYPTVVTGSSGGRHLVVQLNALDCGLEYSQVPPPTLTLQVTVGTRRFPYLLTLGDRAALATLTSSCGQHTDLAAARRYGWTV